MHSTKARALRIATVLFAAIIVTWASTQPQAENDYWLLVRIGAWMIEHRVFAEELVFPFTEAEHFHYNAHEWLAALVLYALDSTFSQTSLALVLGALGLVFFAAVTHMAYAQADKRLSTALILGVLATTAENYRHFLRPELFTLFYLVALLMLLDRLVKVFSFQTLILITLLSSLWANTHGSFVLSLPLTLAFSLDRIVALHKQKSEENRTTNWSSMRTARGLQWFSLPLTTLLGGLCTPFGWKLWAFTLGFTHQSIAKYDITEWMSPFDSRSFTIIGMYPGMALALIMLVLIISHRRTIPIRVSAIGIVFIILACLGNRFMVYQGVISAWALPQIWRHTKKINAAHLSEEVRLLILNGGLILLFLLCLRFGNMNGATPVHANSSTLFSSGMAKALTEPPITGNVFNSYDLGGELIYRTHPLLRPSIDSRIDSYGDTYYFQHESMLDDAMLMEKFLLQWNIRYLLLTREDFIRWNKLPNKTKQACPLQASDTFIYLLHCEQ
jgi:hypothetical protein